MNVNYKDEFIPTLLTLESNLRKLRYHGYDPYDALNLTKLSESNSKYFNMIITQLFVYSPINVRRILGIKKGLNPKAIALIIKSYCLLEKLNLLPKNFCLNVSEALANWLIKNKSNFSSNASWGFNFPWQSSQRKLVRGVPTVVNSSFVGNSFLDLYLLTNKKKYLDVAESVCEFIINDLHIAKFSTGICFSYTPLDNYVVHNANLLGASLLDNTSKINRSEKYRKFSREAFNFTISEQKSNGMWSYSIDKYSKKERYQIDWHQGFILDSLCDYLKNNPESPDLFFSSMKKGAEFFANEQFNQLGVSKWRWPKKWPVDIHNQAQGIFTLANLSSFYDDSLQKSEKIARWTLSNFKNDSGLFYYQKWPFFYNKIIYMRWSQAWMLLALSKLVYERKNKNGNE